MRRGVVVAAVAVPIAAGIVGPRLIVRADDRRAGPLTGLGEPIPGTVTTTVATDDGAELHIVERGSGPPVVLVHGLSLDHRLWQYQYLDLADRCRVIGVDLRGHGRSTLGTAPITPSRLAADLTTVLESLDLQRAVLVGHSLGGTVVGQLCADHPEVVRRRIDRLVFVGSFASSTAGEGRFRELVSPWLVRTTARLQSKDKPRRAGHGAFAYVMARAPFGPRPQPEQVRFTLELGYATLPSVVSEATVANLSYDVRSSLPAIDLPSLVIRGDHDSLSTERSVAQLAAALTHPEVVIFEDCGHLPMLEARARFADALATFATLTET